MKSMGPIYSCNPCGEQQLHFNNSCNLGSIDVAKLINERFDEFLRAVVTQRLLPATEPGQRVPAVEVLRAYGQPKPAAPPPGYRIWPLWYVAIAFWVLPRG